MKVYYAFNWMNAEEIVFTSLLKAKDWLQKSIIASQVRGPPKIHQTQSLADWVWWQKGKRHFFGPSREKNMRARLRS